MPDLARVLQNKSNYCSMYSNQCVYTRVGPFQQPWNIEPLASFFDYVVYMFIPLHCCLEL